ncbi:hypothetical protein LD119_00718 [Mesoplasma sp. JKS002660]|uniref:lipoprotein n=1 Tax=Mesoplasma whartonense TaxID=2878854 RepID=UPI002022ADF4|nr:lipoprotein [Mesoplasma sp. JKS002660]MCL8213767.1 hypothetical protein [Mesoplasma sp. JKS002660]
MKKLLLILGSIGIVITTTTTMIACGTKITQPVWKNLRKLNNSRTINEFLEWDLKPISLTKKTIFNLLWDKNFIWNFIESRFEDLKKKIIEKETIFNDKENDFKLFKEYLKENYDIYWEHKYLDENKIDKNKTIEDITQLFDINELKIYVNFNVNNELVKEKILPEEIIYFEIAIDLI